jgi:DNA polymerase-3 subunit epsilon
LPSIDQTAFAAIDFESAGTSRGQTDVPIQVGIALWSPSEGFGETLCSFLHTERPVTWAARRVHGITTKHLAGAPTLLSLWPELKRLLGGRAIVAHGHGTEKRFLRAFPGHPFGPWIDTLLLSRAAWPGFESHSLGSICDRLGLTPRIENLAPQGRWHDALFDSVASLAVLEHLVHQHGLASRPLDLLLHPDLSEYQKRRH